MQSLVSIANLRSRGFSRFSLLVASLTPNPSPLLRPQARPTIPPALRRLSARPSTRHPNCSYFSSLFRVLRKFLGLRGTHDSPAEHSEKVYPYLSRLYPPSFPFHLAPTTDTYPKTIRTDG